MIRAVFILTRALLHVFTAIFKLAFLSASWSEARRSAEIGRWAYTVFQIFGVTLRVRGLPHEGARGTLFAGNHVSWLDVYALLAAADTRFVAKAEVRQWPLAGWLAEQLGTQFITRERRGDTRHIAASMTTLLAGGKSVCIFPEGTSTDGRALRPFRASLFEPAAQAGFVVQPIALRYTDADGTISDGAAFVGDMTMTQSLWKLAQRRGMTCEVEFLAPIDSRNIGRRTLAARCEQAIAGHLGLLVAAASKPVANEAAASVAFDLAAR